MRALPCTLMRGGTSKGPFFRTSDLPQNPAERDAVLIGVMGSGNELEIDGVGGGYAVTSKVAMVDHSSLDGVDVDYLFAQVGIKERWVDTGPNCGNMLVGVGPFAIETGLVKASDPETTVRIHNVNTGALIDAIVQTPGGVVNYSGNASIDGVPGQAAPVKLTFKASAGSKTGSLFPTGKRIEDVQGIEATLIDMAMPCVLMSARSFGKTGHESADELDSDKSFLAHMERVRIEAGTRMGLPNPADSVLPKVILVAEPAKGGTISGRYFMPHDCHKAFAVTGAICLATACVMEGTIAGKHLNWNGSTGAVRNCVIEHPSGSIAVEIAVGSDGLVSRASLIRTARKLFSGNIFVPDSSKARA